VTGHVRLVRELVYDKREVSVVRLTTAIPRSAVDGGHRRLVAYVAPTVTTAEAVRLLRATAEDLARTLPRLDGRATENAE
jgi:hypothetical protein